MRTTVLFTLCLFLAAAAFSGRALGQIDVSKPEYRSCKTDQDCATVTPACAGPFAVNRAHQQEVQTWYDNQSLANTSPNFKCAVSSAEITPACQHASCVMVAADSIRADADYCENDSECVVVTGRCGKKDIVNLRSAQHRQADMGAFDPAACTAVDNTTAQNPRCEAHRCKADMVAPAPSSGDAAGQR